MTDFPCRSTVTITDNDTVGVRVDPTELTVTEEDPGSGMYTVVLESQPTDTVTVTVGGTADTDVTAEPSSLTFTPGNWSAAQTVTLTARDAGGLTAAQTFGVYVGDRATRAVAVDTLAALGRGYLSSVRSTLGRRLQSTGARSQATVAGQRIPWKHASAMGGACPAACCWRRSAAMAPAIVPAASNSALPSVRLTPRQGRRCRLNSRASATGGRRVRPTSASTCWAWLLSVAGACRQATRWTRSRPGAGRA